MADVIIEPIAELATVESDPVFMTKDMMYDELSLILGDFAKVIAARKAGQDPFPDVEEAGTDGKKKKDKKNRPPRAPSAYNIFMKSVQDQVKAEFPDLKQTELMKHIAARWNESEEKKISDKKRAEALEQVKKDKKAKKSAGADEEKEEEKEEDKKEDKKKEKKSKKRDTDSEPAAKTKKKAKKGE